MLVQSAILLLFLLFSLLSVSVQALTSVPDLNYSYGHAPRSCISTPDSSVTRISFAKYISDNFDDTSPDPFEIPCKYSVFADSSVTATFPRGLVILGSLTFPELPTHITTAIKTPFVLVRGKLLIGSDNAHYTSQVEFVLTNSTEDLIVENESGNQNFDHLVNYGQKAFVVYGGMV